MLDKIPSGIFLIPKPMAMKIKNVPRVKRNTEGQYSIIFGVISIFAMSLVFVPLAAIFGIVALFRRQMLLGILGLLFAAIGFMTSPILLSIFGIAPGGFETKLFKWEYSPRQQIERLQPETQKEFI